MNDSNSRGPLSNYLRSLFVRRRGEASSRSAEIPQDAPLAVAEIVEIAAMELVTKHSLDEVESTLVAQGVDAAFAARIVLLIPSAFAREHFGSEGIEFPSFFSVGPPGLESRRQYEDEPGYPEACSLARSWILEGRPSLVGRVLDWSAEANAISEARTKGLTPTRMASVHHGEVW